MILSNQRFLQMLILVVEQAFFAHNPFVTIPSGVYSTTIRVVEWTQPNRMRFGLVPLLSIMSILLIKTKTDYVD